jgi:membrane protein YdbS with pleckstrin-like domain
MLSVLALLTPTILHRVGERTARVARLRWSIRLQVSGLFLLGVALMTALWGVARFVFGATTSWLVVTPVFVVLIVLWVIVPLLVRRRQRRPNAEPRALQR